MFNIKITRLVKSPYSNSTKWYDIEYVHLSPSCFVFRMDYFRGYWDGHIFSNGFLIVLPSVTAWELFQPVLCVYCEPNMRKWKLAENGERKGKVRWREKEKKKWLSFFSSSQQNLPFQELSLHILGRQLWSMLALRKHFCSRNQRNVGSGTQFSKQNKQDSFYYRITSRLP